MKRKKIKNRLTVVESQKLLFDVVNLIIPFLVFRWRIIKKISIIIMLMISPLLALTQKKMISVDTYKRWKTVSAGGISNNGAIIFYNVNNEPTDETTLIIHETNKNWEMKLPKVTNPKITDDSKFLIGTLPNDSLLILDLKSRITSKLQIKNDYKILYGKNLPYLIYTTIQNDLVIKSLSSNNIITFKFVEDYKINSEFTTIIYTQSTLNNKNSVCWGDPNTGSSKIIFKGEKISDLIIDTKGNQGAFFVKKNNDQSIYYYNNEKDTAELMVDEHTIGVEKGVSLNSGYFRFSSDNQNIFFSLKSNEEKFDSLNKSEPRIWSYQDQYLQSTYFDKYASKTNSYLTIMNINTKKINQLLHGNEKISNNTFNDSNDIMFVIENCHGNLDDITTKDIKTDYSICFTRTGAREILQLGQKSPLCNIRVSPKNKFICFYDPELKNYLSFNTQNHKIVNITKTVNEDFYRYHLNKYPKANLLPPGIIGWYKNEDAILINSQFDIWRIDPNAVNNPENLTQGIGSRTNTIFNIASERYKSNIDWKENIILTGINLDTKNLTLYDLSLAKKSHLQKLYTGDSYVYPMENYYFEMLPDNFVKAKNSKKYLFLKQTTTEAPNYYYSNNLIDFQQVSNIQPQTNYNWVRSELISFVDSMGNHNQAILYKPENFDPQKKYPIIFNYYTEKTNLLNSFLSIEPVGMDFNIPLAVSNGYLVCLPDINIELGHAGEGALKTVIRMVQYLSSYTWADTSKMGIAGHSFGGFETNYIITHTNMFKAAISGAGVSDFVSMANEIWSIGGESKQYYYQYSVPRMGESFLENSGIYLENSAILNAHKVNTPLLILHNSGDRAVPVRQSRQLFILLRSAGKKVWWLDYESEDHMLVNPKNRLDYTSKSLEFFDHFLKETVTPIWMANFLSPQ